MKTIKLIFFQIAILCATSSFAQTATYQSLFSEALNKVYADLPNNCKTLCGKQDEKFQTTFESKVIFPKSFKNLFDIFQYEKYPVIFRSYMEADDDNVKALNKQNEIGNTVLQTTVKYENKSYKIIYVQAESKTGDKPKYVYKLENGPQELENVRIYVNKESSFFSNEVNKYHFAIGIYRKLE